MGRSKAGPPLAGAYEHFDFLFSNGAVSGTYTAKSSVPTGMEVVLYGASVNVDGLAGNPQVAVYQDAVSTAIYTADTTVATNLGYVALSATALVDTSLHVTVTNDSTADAFDALHVSVFGYVKEHPTGVGEGRP